LQKEFNLRSNEGGKIKQFPKTQNDSGEGRAAKGGGFALSLLGGTWEALKGKRTAAIIRLSTLKPIIGLGEKGGWDRKKKKKNSPEKGSLITCAPNGKLEGRRNGRYNRKINPQKRKKPSRRGGVSVARSVGRSGVGSKKTGRKS